MAEPATDSFPRPHRYRIRVYYEDTDAGGIVYHANYLKFAERARSELLSEAGFEHRDLAAEYGAGFAVRHASVDFIRPAVLDDRLDVETRISNLGGASVDMRQTIHRDDTVLADIGIRLAMIDGGGRPIRIPAAIGDALRAYLHAEHGDTL